MRGNVILLVFVILFTSITSAFLISDQGTNVRETATGNLLALGNVTIEIYDNTTAGNLVFSQEFNESIVNGSWNVMINPDLKYGISYWKNYQINGEDLDFDGNERLEFQSSIGKINNISFINFSLINSCPEGSSIRLVYENGSVECETDDSGTGADGSYNETYESYNTTYNYLWKNWTSEANITLYNAYNKWWYNMSDGTGNGNLTFNETRTNELYAGIQWGYNHTSPALTYTNEVNNTLASWIATIYTTLANLNTASVNLQTNISDVNSSLDIKIENLDASGNTINGTRLTIENITNFNYNYNQSSPYDVYNYNMTDGSYNVTYDKWAYNMSDGNDGSVTNGTILDITNITGFNYNYNTTEGAFSFIDTASTNLQTNISDINSSLDTKIENLPLGGTINGTTLSIENITNFNYNYNQSDGSYNTTYQNYAYNQTIGAEEYTNTASINLQINISDVNSSLDNKIENLEITGNTINGTRLTIENITNFNYNYNQSDGSYNISYQNYMYNETYTGGTYNQTYHGLNVSYNKWWYNQSATIYYYNQSGIYYYNQTSAVEAGYNAGDENLQANITNLNATYNYLWKNWTSEANSTIYSAYSRWFYNMTTDSGADGSYNATYESYNTTFGKYWYNQTGIYYYNQTLPLMKWDYNQTEAANNSLIDAYGKWFYNMTGEAGSTYNVTYDALNSTYGKYWYNQTGIYYYNQTQASNTYTDTSSNNLQANITDVNSSLDNKIENLEITGNTINGTRLTIENITNFNYNYNQSDGSYNISYQNYMYNETYTGGTYNQTYHGLNVSYNKWWYNQSATIYYYNQSGIYYYNQTSGANTYTDTASTNLQTNISDVNSSLDTKINSISSGNASWNESYSYTILMNKTYDYNQTQAANKSIVETYSLGLNWTVATNKTMADAYSWSWINWTSEANITIWNAYSKWWYNMSDGGSVINGTRLTIENITEFNYNYNQSSPYDTYNYNMSGIYYYNQSDGSYNSTYESYVQNYSDMAMQNQSNDYAGIQTFNNTLNITGSNKTYQGGGNSYWNGTCLIISGLNSAIELC